MARPQRDPFVRHSPQPVPLKKGKTFTKFLKKAGRRALLGGVVFSAGAFAHKNRAVIKEKVKHAIKRRSAKVIQFQQER